MATPAPAIETHELQKTYGGVTALAGVDLELRQGEILGFVGPNGAGKSTFLKVLVGLVRPSGGSARVFGLDVTQDGAAARRRIGYVPGDLGVYRNARGSDFLRFTMGFHPRPDHAKARRLAAAMDLPLSTRLRTWSTGMRQKIGILQALCVDADLLLLDEATRGLDPTSQAAMQDLLLEERAAGRAIVLSSHVLDEVERVADRLVFLDRGRVVEEQELERVRERFRRTLVLAPRRPADVEAFRALERHPGVAAVDVLGHEVHVRLAGDVREVLGALAALPPAAIEHDRPRLQDLYREFYLRPEHPAGGAGQAGGAGEAGEMDEPREAPR